MPVIADPLNHIKVPRLTITSERGVPFLVLFEIETGLVEFWDLRYPMTHFNREVHERIGKVTMPGQFVSRYFLLTLIGQGDGIGHNQWKALNLYGGEPDWYIDGPAMHQVRTWLRFTRNRVQTAPEQDTETST